MIDQRYPLQWPVGYKRTKNRQRSNFKQTYDRAQQFLHEEVRRLGGTNLIVSTNLPIRNDGMVYAAYLGRKIDDPGVAVYFKYKGKDTVLACDHYSSVWENIYALAKGIENLRGIDRWGISEFMDRSFTGFAALPAPALPDKNPWWVVFGWNEMPPKNDAHAHHAYLMYRRMVKTTHPDAGGSKQEFQELNSAYEEAKKYFGYD